MPVNKKINNLKYALRYHELGFAPLPLYPIRNGKCACRLDKACNSPGKHPWVKYNYEDMPVRSDWGMVKKWFIQQPDSGIGLLTGQRGGIIVLDVDGELGKKTLKERELQLPPTVIVKTGRADGGLHYYFKAPDFVTDNFTGGNQYDKLPGLDFRGDGGLVVAPPTLHVSGNFYEFVVAPIGWGDND